MRVEEAARPSLSDASATDGLRLPLIELAPAKINLTLAVKGRRADGYHELASLVAFASIGDELRLVAASRLSLEVTGAFATETGPTEENLVLKAARALIRRQPHLRLGELRLEKRLPVAAGLGGGSADAAAALRLIARLNGMAPGSEALIEAAQETGSDVPVCLALGSRMMRGRGEILGPRLEPPHLHAVLVNPNIRLDTARVFAAFGSRPRLEPCGEFLPPRPAATRRDWLAAVAECGNDLEAAAIELAPEIELTKRELRAEPGCLLARMTGSGATLFGIFEEERLAANALAALATRHKGWWVRQVTLSA
jgi:4-diphosphocytidyl-2-C-methyl-D-erythritol kinase